MFVQKYIIFFLRKLYVVGVLCKNYEFFKIYIFDLKYDYMEIEKIYVNFFQYLFFRNNDLIEMKV